MGTIDGTRVFVPGVWTSDDGLRWVVGVCDGDLFCAGVETVVGEKPAGKREASTTLKKSHPKASIAKS